MLRLFCVLMLSLAALTGCASSATQNIPADPSAMDNLAGVWVPDARGPVLVLDAGGALALVDGNGPSGTTWHASGTMLSLGIMEGGIVKEKTARYLLLTPDILSLTRADGHIMQYRRNAEAIGSIHGSLFYRERMALPPDATAHISLIDISRADAPAVTLSNIVLTGANRTPLPFSIYYRKADISPRHTYAIHAEIKVNGERMFMNTDSYRVLSPGAPASVDILLHRMMSPVAPTAAAETATSASTAPVPAPAATANATAIAAPAAEAATASLQNTYWKLTALEGKAVAVYDNQPEPHLVLLDDGKNAGSDGCNRFFGTYTTTGDTIAFGPGGSTMMACPQGAQQSAAYLATLHKATGFRLHGDKLELLAKDAVIATFVAQPLK